MHRLTIACLAVLLTSVPTPAQDAKQIKTKKGTSVALVNLLNAKPDCSSNMNPIEVPIVRDKPTNGTIQMTILVANVAASGNCPARQVPVITLIYKIYTPKPDFVGNDVVTIEVDNNNRVTSLSYRISVLAPGESL
jgi:hypothetical protein